MRRRVASAGLFILAPVLFAPALCLVDVPLSNADTSNIAQSNSDQWRLGRILGVSSTGIIMPRLRALAGSGALLGRLADYMEDVVSGSGAVFNCEVRSSSDWSKHLKHFSALRSWPLANTDCVSASTAREEELGTKPEVAFEMTHTLMRMMRYVYPDVVKDAGENATALFDERARGNPVADDWYHSSGRYICVERFLASWKVSF